MSNPSQGWNIISRGTLKDMVRDSFRYERELQDRLHEAYTEYHKRAGGIDDTNRRVAIFKEVAAKYGFREQFLMEKIKI